MKRIRIIILIFLLVIIYLLKINLKNSSIEQFYHINSVFSNNFITQQNFKKNFNKLFSKDTVYCSVNENLQNKINESIGKTLILGSGTHKSYFLTLPSNIKIIVPKNATIKLADDCVIDQSSYGEAVGDAVIKINGNENNFIENVFFELQGKIDGNKSVHPYSKGGVEGINLKWAKNVYIYGSGSIINANGDGLDIDVSNNCYIEGISVINNDGGGIHFGSPRPIKSSFNNLVVGCIAKSNGFLHQRAGFDQSWPNINAVTYFNCNAEDNFQNWDIRGSGALLLNSMSQSESLIKPDYFDDALFSDLYYENNTKLISKNHKITETGYYFLTVKKSLLSESKIILNDNEIGNLSILSLKEDMEISKGIYFFNKNDSIKLSRKDDDKSNNSLKLDLILPIENVYPDSYDLKIISWRIKSEINKIIYNIYSFFF